MPPSRTRTSDLSSKRTIARTKDLWLEFFSSAIDSIMNSDSERVKEYTEAEADAIALSARRIADAALSQAEERFPGL